MGCNNPQMATQDQTTAHTAACFVVACMDFRLVDDCVHFMNSIGYNNNYDQFVLAGASLGFSQDKYPQWGQTLLEHLTIGKGLHQLREVIFIDHKDCGAFKKFYPDITHENQMSYHKKHMQQARDKLGKVFPNLKFKGFIMDIHGKCQPIVVKQHENVDPKDVKDDGFLTTLHLQ